METDTTDGPAQLSDVILDAIAFVEIVRCGSLSAAAKELNVRPSTVSRSLSRLESKLGAQLLTRTSRRQSLTLDGVRFYSYAKVAVEQFQAGISLSTKTGAIKGHVRIGAPSIYCKHRLIKRIAPLLKDNPELEIDVQTIGPILEPGWERFDLVICDGGVGMNEARARRLDRTEMAFVASPTYLDAHGAPHTLGDLERHQLILKNRLEPRGAPVWLIREDERDKPWRPSSPIKRYLIARDEQVGITMAVADLGVMHTHRFAVEDELTDGALVEVLPQHGRVKARWFALTPGQDETGAAATYVINALSH